MNRAFKFRLYPNKSQQTLINKTFGSVRFVYNLMLEERIKHYKETGKSLKNTPAQYKNKFPWLKAVDSLALANAQLHLNTAFKNFFDSHGKVGYPQFNSKRRSKASYTTNNQKGSVRIEGNKIRLPKVGFVKFVQHRAIPEGWVIKSVTVSMTHTSKYFVSVLFEYENQVSEKMPESFVGLDYSMHELFVSSAEVRANSPDFYRQAETKLAREQRKLSHCQHVKDKPNKNYEKQRLKLAKFHEKVANQRKDFLHKLSRQLSDQYDAVCIEDLNMQAMSQALNFGKSVMGNAWGMFMTMLEYKLADRGKKLVKIDKFFPSSQLCHVCGYKNPETKDLSVREWTCPKCGAHHDRDVNAAINIREEGKRILSA